jgi:hypothetical protein
MLLPHRWAQSLPRVASNRGLVEGIPQVIMDDQGLDVVVLRPRAVGNRLIDQPLTAFGHEAMTHEPLNSLFVQRRPNSSLATRGEPLDHPVVIDPFGHAVDPAKAERFLHELVVKRAVERARLLPVDEPETI